MILNNSEKTKRQLSRHKWELLRQGTCRGGSSFKSKIISWIVAFLWSFSLPFSPTSTISTQNGKINHRVQTYLSQVFSNVFILSIHLIFASTVDISCDLVDLKIITSSRKACFGRLLVKIQNEILFFVPNARYLQLHERPLYYT